MGRLYMLSGALLTFYVFFWKTRAKIFYCSPSAAHAKRQLYCRLDVGAQSAATEHDHPRKPAELDRANARVPLYCSA
jgi:hypothetical protein